MRKSYRRCLASNREFINDFYARFLKNSPHAGDFSEIQRKRQSAMLQMAIDVLLDLDQRKDYLVRLVHSDNKSHSKYALPDFEKFLDTLVKTVKKYDQDWDNTVAKAWTEIKEKAMTVIRNEREKPGKVKM